MNLLEERLPEAWRGPSHLAPALEVWGQVLSRPEPTLAVLNFGKRDAGHDLGLPSPVRWCRQGQASQPAPSSWRLQTLFDQHAKLALPTEAELAVGDLVGCAISHPCTTFDKWEVVFALDDEDRVVEAIRTFF